MNRRSPSATQSALRRVLGKGTAQRAYAAAVGTSYGQIAVALIVNIAMVPLYLSQLGEYRFGVLMMLLAVVNFAALGVTWVSGGSLRLLASAYAAQDEAQFQRTLTVSRWVLVGYAVLVSVLIGAPLWWAVGGGIEVPTEHVASVRGGIAGAAVYLVVLYAFNADRVGLTSRGQQAWADTLTIVSQVAFVTLTVPILLAGGDLVAVTMAFAAGALLALGLSRVVWRRLGLRTRTFERPQRSHLAVAKKLTGRMGVAYMAYGTLALGLQADTLLVGALAGPTVVAAFVLVWRPAEMAALALWRIPEAMQPFLVHMDTRNETPRLRRSFWLAVATMAGLGALVAVVYAIAGPTLVALWVGDDPAPDNRWAYVLAGTAVFWLAVARVPLVFAYATYRLRRVTLAMAAELALKLGLIAALFEIAGFITPMLVINALHLAGFAWLYLRLGSQAAAASVPRVDTSESEDGRGA